MGAHTLPGEVLLPFPGPDADVGGLAVSLMESSTPVAIFKSEAGVPHIVGGVEVLLRWGLPLWWCVA